jgi:hypothetical protein
MDQALLPIRQAYPFDQWKKQDVVPSLQSMDNPASSTTIRDRLSETKQQAITIQVTFKLQEQTEWQ